MEFYKEDVPKSEIWQVFQIAPCYEEVLYTLGSVHCYTPSNTWCNILEVQKWTMKAGRVTRKIITRDTLVDSI